MEKSMDLIIKQIKHMNLPPQKQLIAFMLFMNPNDNNVPSVPVPTWVQDLGHNLHNLVDKNIIKKIYFDSNEVVHVTL